VVEMSKKLFNDVAEFLQDVSDIEELDEGEDI